VPDLRAPAAPETIRDTAGRVLDGPAYASAEPNLVQRALARLFDAIARAIAELSAAPGGRPSTLATIALVAVAVLLVGAAAWWLARRVDPGTAAAVDVGPRPGRDAAGWRTEAEGLEALGDLRAATLAWFRACTTSLREAGLLDDRPGMTVGEVRHAVVDAHPQHRDLVDDAAHAFEDVWYGDADPAAGPLRALRAAALGLARRKARV
jgi:hypothetical protein